MTDREPKEGEGTTNGETARTRKPYEKPSFRSEAVFETMALACGKISSLEFQCRLNRKNS